MMPTPMLKIGPPKTSPRVLAERCYMHFLRNALDYVPRKVDDDRLLEPRWIYDRRDLSEVWRDLAAWLAKWGGKYPKLTGWVEENIEETLTYFRLPLAYRKHMKSTTCWSGSTRRIRRRIYVVRIFPNAESCLRLVRALTIERHEAYHINSESFYHKLKQSSRAPYDTYIRMMRAEIGSRLINACDIRDVNR